MCSFLKTITEVILIKFQNPKGEGPKARVHQVTKLDTEKESLETFAWSSPTTSSLFGEATGKPRSIMRQVKVLTKGMNKSFEFFNTL